MKQTTEFKAERITKKLVLLRQEVELNLKRRCDDEDGNDGSIMKTEGNGGGGFSHCLFNACVVPALVSIRPSSRLISTTSLSSGCHCQSHLTEEEAKVTWPVLLTSTSADTR